MRVPFPIIRVSAISAALACACLLTGFPIDAQSTPDTSPKALVAAANKYVAEYASKMTFVLAEETYLQETYSSRERRTGSRLMKGELFLTYLQADREWIAVHDFADVDGEPVKDRESLQTLLTQGAVSAVAQRVANRNARYNLGTIQRNFNEPTLALLVLDAKRSGNFSFTRQRVEQAGEATLVTLGFVEKERPTLVSGGTGAPIYSRGEIVIEAGTGRVRGTRMAFKYGNIEAELATIYSPDPRLEMWVPKTFTEEYQGERNGLREIIQCTATYTNYRRFEATGRIKGEKSEIVN